MKRILIIEDNQQVLEDVEEVLSLKNFHAITAQNGIGGLQMAEEEHPDLILCDVMMPELDGFDVLKILRQNPLTANIPFIFLTAKNSRTHMREGMELGADDYLTKPFTSQELLKAISTRIEKQEVIKQENAAKLDNFRLNIAHCLPHELLTPLHGILGMSDLLLNYYESMEPRETIDSIQTIYDCGLRLHRLAKNFIFFSELEAIATSPNVWQDNPEFTDVKDIICYSAHNFAEKAKRKKDLELDLEDAIIRMSSKYLTKLVEEIVENAFKFSESGTPVRLISRVNEKLFTLHIIDQGRGMTDEQITNVGAYMQFERKHYEQQGNGLGLIIAKRIVEIHGGGFSIKSSSEIVENIVRHQTVICITLPRLTIDTST
ncbi:response regulator [Pseudanabaena sp. BC1403]|uniref:hybrid sensor histidine kinase/response regulator n=1 Tax=Pseudanabaena sp. BC1403 TaxID=2043171 RepID=UPI000CD91DC2|nr:response regulator [Pseudanabaena sp. BC1403]